MPIIALVRSPFSARLSRSWPCAAYFLGHPQDPVGNAVEHALVGFEIFRTREQSLVELRLLDDVIACAPAWRQSIGFGAYSDRAARMLSPTA